MGSVIIKYSINANKDASFVFDFNRIGGENMSNRRKVAIMIIIVIIVVFWTEPLY